MLIHCFWRIATLRAYMNTELLKHRTLVPVAHSKSRLPDLNLYDDPSASSSNLFIRVIFIPYRSAS